MSEQTPRITSLQPFVLEDNRRVMFKMVVEGLPTVFSNVAFSMPDMSDTPPTRPPKPNSDAPSPYPNIELSILNSRRQQIASLYIIEHKEPQTSLTLHLSSPDVQDQYIARAEMTHRDETIDLIEVPFILHQVN